MFCVGGEAKRVRGGESHGGNGSILVTGAAGQVGRIVTSLLLDRGLPVPAWFAARTIERQPYEPPAPKWCLETYSN